MPVDKAFEKEKADMQIQSKGPLIDEMRRAWFYAGYEAGQKSLSPEVREVLGRVYNKSRAESSGDCLDSYCVFCGSVGKKYLDIRHYDGCPIPDIEKQLDKE